MIDRRILKVEADHAQDRTKRPRVNFTLKGEDFLDGVLEGTWVNPITKKLQVMPNSEHPDFQTSDAGYFRKDKISDGATLDYNAEPGEFKMAAAMGMHGDSAIKYIGENIDGVGIVFDAVSPANSGYTFIVYSYSSGNEQRGSLIEMFVGADPDLSGGGLSFVAYHDGRIEVFKDSFDQPVWRGDFTGGGYTPGTVRGGSYARPSNKFVMIRIEVSGPYITITSSLGGIAQFQPEWGRDRYNDDGTLFAAAEPLIPEGTWGWYIPEGGAMVVSSQVDYNVTGSYAMSPVFSLAEVPSYYGPPETDVLTGRVIPYSPDVYVSLYKPDGVTPYDRTSTEFRAKVEFVAPAFLTAVVGSYPRIAVPMSVPDGGPFDISDWVISCTPFGPEDGTEGAGLDLVIAKSIRKEIDEEEVSVPCPAPFIEEVELRPFRLSLVPHPEDPGESVTTVILDGVGSAPEWIDFPHGEDGEAIHIRVNDRMALVREAKWRETVVFDGLPFCAPPGDPDLLGQESFVALCLREGGIRTAELAELPRVENEDGSLFAISDDPPQIAGDFNFSAKTRQLVEDSLIDGWEMAPQYAWGLRPRAAGTRAYAVDVQGDEAAVATFYRHPETGALDPLYETNEVGAWPLMYGQPHRRIKLAKEGNVIRVVGRNPGTGKYLSAFIRQPASADPEAPISPDKLGVPREIYRRLRALTNQAQVNAVARSLDAAVAQRQYTHSWPAFMRFLPDGSPVWRGDMVTLEAANPDGTDAKVRVSGFSVDIRDENGGGLMDDTGARAPVSIRLASYSAGALIGNGGTTAWEIARRQRERVKDGGVGIGFNETLDTFQGRTNDLTP